MDPRAVVVLILGVVFAVAGVFDYLMSSTNIGSSLTDVFSNLHSTSPSGFLSKITALVSGKGAMKTVTIEANLKFGTSPLMELYFEEPADISITLVDERMNIIKVGVGKKNTMDVSLEEGTVDIQNFYGSISLSETIEMEGTADKLVLPDRVSLSNQLGSLYTMGYGLKLSEVKIINASIRDLYLPPVSGTIYLNDRTIKCTLENDAIMLPLFTGDIVFHKDSITIKGTAKISAIDAICGG